MAWWLAYTEEDLNRLFAMGIRKYFAIYSYHGGGVRGFKRCYDTFSQVDLFDFKRLFINTRENIRDGYSDSDYMFYAPVYSEVLEEMIYVARLLGLGN